MEKHMDAVVGELKRQIKANLKRINANQDVINDILSMSSHTERQSREQEFESLFDENKLLLSKNDDLIKLQIELLKFNKKYGEGGKETVETSSEDVKVNIKKEYTAEEMFDMTVREVVPFNTSHPYFNDEKFFNRLVNHFANQERYETCDELVKMRR